MGSSRLFLASLQFYFYVRDAYLLEPCLDKSRAGLVRRFGSLGLLIRYSGSINDSDGEGKNRVVEDVDVHSLRCLDSIRDHESGIVDKLNTIALYTIT